MMKIIMALQMKWIMEVMLLKHGYLICITVFPLLKLYPNSGEKGSGNNNDNSTAEILNWVNIMMFLFL